MTVVGSRVTYLKHFGLGFKFRVIDGALSCFGGNHLKTEVVSLGIRWLTLALAVWVAGALIDGINLGGVVSTLLVAAILGLLNLTVRPILVLLSLPITILTLGLFLIVINAILLGLTDWIANIDDDIRFNVESIGAALAGAVVISIAGVILGIFINPDRIARDITGRI